MDKITQDGMDSELDFDLAAITTLNHDELRVEALEDRLELASCCCCCCCVEN